MRANPKLYEINTVTWLYELSEKYGKQLTIGNIPSQEWDRFKDMGFNYIWLMGVWKRSKKGMEIFRNKSEPALTAVRYASFKSMVDSILPGSTENDIIGSPYSVASYDPDPLIGSWKDIDKAKDELHKRDMRLILDFVPNHTAPDHPWVLKNSDYYIQGSESDFKQDPELFLPIDIGHEIFKLSHVLKKRKTLYIAHGKDPYFLPWTDTVQLNHFNPKMRSALIKELKKISKHCDGVRCDMAMLVLNDIFYRTWGWLGNSASFKQQNNEFWTDVRDAVPDFLLIAEAYWDTEYLLQTLGFDYVYDKRLYDRLKTASPYEIFLHLQADRDYQKKLVRFIENHDEKRSASVFGREKLQAVAVLFSTIPGMKLYHQGQFEGRKIHQPIQLCRLPLEEPDTELYTFYKKLFSIIANEVFSNGDWELKNISPCFDDSFHSLVAYVWKSNKALKLVVVNLTPYFSQGRIPLVNEVSPRSNYIFFDELNNSKYKRNGKEISNPGLHVILEGFNCHIFDIAPVDTLGK